MRPALPLRRAANSGPQAWRVRRWNARAGRTRRGRACAARAASAAAAAATARRGARYALRRPPRPFSLPLRAAAHALLRAAARASASGSALRRRPLSLELRLRPAALHGIEQYLIARFDVENFLPHSLHFTAITLPSSLLILALHRLQWAGRLPPYGAKSRPHSPQAYGSAAFALRFRLLTSWPARGGGSSPRSLALRAAAATLVRASIRARFTGSAAYLR